MYFVEKTKGMNIFKQYDYLLFITVLLLSAMGLVILRSATLTMNGGDKMVIKQALFIVVGVVAAVIISIIDYKDLKVLGIPLYILSVVLLVYTYFRGVGKETWGSNSWIDIGGFFSFQPSEIAKISVIIMASIFLERIKEGQDVGKNIAKLIFYFSVPVGLVVIQPDYGTTIVFMFIIFVMIFVCGFPYKYILGAIVALIPTSLFTWFFLLNDNRRERILVFLDPSRDPQGAGWQVRYAIRAVGSGQIFGKGLFKGVLNRRNMVPVKESDSIFAVVGEELGFVGSMILLILIFIILMRCIYIAKNSRDLFGSFLTIGIMGMLGFHFIQNIGMNIGLLPLTGIPLPFVSQGGSAMLTNFAAVGILLSVSMRRKKAIFNSSQ